MCFVSQRRVYLAKKEAQVGKKKKPKPKPQTCSYIARKRGKYKEMGRLSYPLYYWGSSSGWILFPCQYENNLLHFFHLKYCEEMKAVGKILSRHLKDNSALTVTLFESLTLKVLIFFQTEHQFSNVFSHTAKIAFEWKLWQPNTCHHETCLPPKWRRRFCIFALNPYSLFHSLLLSWAEDFAL